MDFSHQSPTVIFVCSFFAIVPLAALLGFATEELALRVGDAFGGLLNATFGNAVELIIAILALIKGELNVVRSAMLGSILSNCLLVMGGSFFAGGIRFHEQGYSIRAAQLNINLLGISGESKKKKRILFFLRSCWPEICHSSRRYRRTYCFPLFPRMEQDSRCRSNCRSKRLN